MYMELVRLVESAPPSEALIRVYSSYCVLNSRAAKLMGLSPEGGVMVFYDKEQKEAGRMRLYIGRKDTDAFPVIRRGRSYLINSRHLARELADNMEGRGSYRICPEDSVEKCGTTYYNIFFRKYGNR